MCPDCFMLFRRQIPKLCLEDLELSARAYNCLINCGLRQDADVSQILEISPGEVEGLGPVCFWEILAALDMKGTPRLDIAASEFWNSVPSHWKAPGMINHSTRSNQFTAPLRSLVDLYAALSIAPEHMPRPKPQA